jgi:hypothetical protein
MRQGFADIENAAGAAMAFMSGTPCLSVEAFLAFVALAK